MMVSKQKVIRTIPGDNLSLKEINDYLAHGWNVVFRPIVVKTATGYEVEYVISDWNDEDEEDEEWQSNPLQ